MTGIATHGRAAGLVLVGAAVGLAVLVLRAPMAVSVFGLASLGILHICLELRYVIGRFADNLAGTLGWVLLLVLTLLAGTRVVATADPTLGHRLEALGAFGLVSLAVWIGLRGDRRTLGLVVVAVVGVACLIWPQWYWHVITHLHNFLPLAFLWDWSARLASRARLWFLAAQGVWAVLIPALILGGTVDRWIVAAPGLAADWVGDGSRLAAAAAPPGASAEMALRYLVAFAFLQSMHYVIWIGFFPLAAREATVAFGRVLPLLRGWRLPLLGVVAGGLVAATFWSSYALGRQIYSLVATYHVYVEFPVLIFLLLGLQGRPCIRLKFCAPW